MSKTHLLRNYLKFSCVFEVNFFKFFHIYYDTVSIEREKYVNINKYSLFFYYSCSSNVLRLYTMKYEVYDTKFEQTCFLFLCLCVNHVLITLVSQSYVLFSNQFMVFCNTSKFSFSKIIKLESLGTLL